MPKLIVYVACADDQAIDIRRLDPGTGALATIGRAVVSATASPSQSMPLALSPDRRQLYVALRVAPFAALTLAIDPATGLLTPLGSAPLPGSMCALAVDAAGTLLLSASYEGATVGVNRIGADKVAAAILRSIATPPKAHCVVVSPDNRFAYATSLGGDTIHRWPLDPASGLGAEAPPFALHAGAGPRHLAFAPSGMLYVINEVDGTLSVLARDTATGALSHVQTVETCPQDGAGGAAAADIHLTPDGSLLYASIRSTNHIAGFRVDPADGTLTPCGQTEVEDTPRSFAIAPNGRFLVSAGRNTASIGVYAIDSGTGSLTRLARYPTGANPNWVEIVALPD